MARIAAAMIIAMIGMILLSVAYCQAQAGIYQHLAVEKKLMMGCAYVSTILMFPDILGWFTGLFRKKK